MYLPIIVRTFLPTVAGFFIGYGIGYYRSITKG